MKRQVKGAALDGGNAFVRQLGAAVDQAGLFSDVGHGLARDLFVVRFVGLAEVGGVGAVSYTPLTLPTNLRV